MANQMRLRAHELACVRGERTLFTDVSFELAPGMALQVCGANGSGKTSLLRQLCGLSAPDNGRVLWEGRDVQSIRSRFSASLAYLGHADGVKADLAGWENLVFSAELAGIRLSAGQAMDALDQLGLGDVADLPARALSQGQRKRVALAGLLPRRDRPLWILDEPFSALDQDAIGAVRDVLAQHLADGNMLVYTTHQELDLDGAMRLELGAQRAC